jgi:hypothetical protein
LADAGVELRIRTTTRQDDFSGRCGIVSPADDQGRRYGIPSFQSWESWPTAFSAVEDAGTRQPVINGQQYNFANFTCQNAMRSSFLFLENPPPYEADAETDFPYAGFAQSSHPQEEGLGMSSPLERDGSRLKDETVAHPAAAPQNNNFRVIAT